MGEAGDAAMADEAGLVAPPPAPARADDAAALRRLLAFLPDPLVIVEVGGRVLRANPAAQRLFGGDPAGRDLADCLGEDPAALGAYLRRCSGSGSPVVGAATLRQPDGRRRSLQAQGAVLQPAGPGRAATLILRLRPDAVAEFSVLAQNVRELNREVRQRRRAQAALEEALAHREALLSELQHRVKNHTQTLLGMLSLAQREASSPELTLFIARMRGRLAAVGTAQQLMYRAGQTETLPARDFIVSLCAAIAAGWPDGATLTAVAEELDLRNDVAPSLALIVNELAGNALRHGLGFGPGSVVVTLERAGPELLLTVWDSGGTWREPTTQRRASGLALVRGLCRQIGGRFEVVRSEGTACLVRFPGAGAAEGRA